MDGFKEGFSIGYAGSMRRRDVAENIPLHIGSHEDMWLKMMKETKLGRYSGPFHEIPFEYYVQSPIGLVPKAGGQMRLIFHLSYHFGEEENQKSLNYWTPEELCSVQYKDLDFAVKACLRLISRIQKEGTDLQQGMLNHIGQFFPIIFYSKSDLRSAFRILPILPWQRCLLVMKCINPETGSYMYFSDNCLPFGSSVSCAQFTYFSEALRHIVEFATGKYFRVVNYLDDFLFIEKSEENCNQMVRTFLDICSDIGCPVALDKTEWATTRIVFLGILLDGSTHRLAIPQEKIAKARKFLDWVAQRDKVTIKFIQRLTGTLNFLNKVVVPGRTFTRRLYSKLKTTDRFGKELKPYHHVKLSKEFKVDCEMWRFFLNNAGVKELCRPFVDFSISVYARKLNFYTDSSLNPDLGMGGVFNERWFCQAWGRDFVLQQRPSIAYLELYALVTAVMMWGDDYRLSNSRIIIFCDNKGVRDMVNLQVSNCRKCMKLIRLLVLSNIKHNRRIFVEYVASKENSLADALSRFEFSRFWRKAPSYMNNKPDRMPECMWPIQKLWFD